MLLLQCGLALSGRKWKTNLRSGTRSVKRPNIIFVLVDDMDKELGSPYVMKKTQQLLRQEGADFVNAFVTTPMCCPSRTSILTGKYAHNHHTNTNNWNCSSPSWRKGPEKKTYARYLELAGYVTGHFGKYLNEYDGSWVPIGWKKWEGLLHNSKFYNYTLRHNTYQERHKMSYEHDYFTDLITNRSISFIKRTIATNPRSPFLAVVSHAAPHGPETPAPQYSTAFPDVKAPRQPNWNFVSVDKQWILRQKVPMDAQKIQFVDLLHRRRLQTLLSVDDSVARIVSTLQSLGIENETYIFFTSDHGYHLGQFALVKGKSMPFESDIRVPFYVRGPNIPKNIRMKEMIGNIDIAPTFLDIAGVSAPRDMDGSSVIRLFRKSRDGRRSKKKEQVKWRDTILIERSRGWRGMKTNNVFKSRNRTQTAKERKTTLLATICSRNKHQSPCQPKQLWECVIADGRYRLRKCRKNSGTTSSPPTPFTTPTTPDKMCVCTKLRPEQDDQGGMTTYYEQQIKDDPGLLLAKELRRRTKRTRFFYNDKPRRSKAELNARKYYKELARAQRLQNRREKSKMLLSGSRTRPTTSQEGSDLGLADVQDVFEEKLGKLREKIWETKLRLDALRDRRKKLLLISARDRLIEYPCPCYPGNSTERERATRASTQKGGEKPEDNSEDEESSLAPRKGRNKPLNLMSRKVEPKKKKVKTSLRRSKCSSPGVNCFYQTNDHWRLPPLWTGGGFCFCPNAANNSYWCLRTINTTHNFLYCEFVTNFLEFFDLNQDPYQLYNVIHEVDPGVLSQLHQQLNRMRVCQGEDCTCYHGKKYDVTTTSSPLTAALSPSVWTRPVVAVTTENKGLSIVNASENRVALNVKKIRNLTALNPSLSGSSPSPKQSRSEKIQNLWGPFVSTPEVPIDISEKAESLMSLTVTTFKSTELKLQTEHFITPLLSPTKSIVGKKSSTTSKPNPMSFGETTINEETEVIPTSDAERPIENVSQPTNGSENVTTAVVTTPEQNSSKTAPLMKVPKTLNVNEIAVSEYSTVKPARRKSSKRRKNGEKEGKGPSKKSKKSKKGKKKQVGKAISLVPSASGEDFFELQKNQTRTDTKSEKEKPVSGSSKNNEDDNRPSPENSRKQNKKPFEKRLTTNSKKRDKKPTKKTTSPRINNEGIGEDETTVSPLNGGDGI